MPKLQVDYSLYLVTGRELLPEGKDYYESLEESLQGGVTLVQVREKNVDTGEFVEIARRTKEITDKYNVPLLINDRVDVYQAVGASGIHIGQTDLPLPLARKLIGPDAIIGVSVSTVDEARIAVRDGADYVGIGAVWPTGSKDVTAKVKLAPEGVGAVLDVLAGTGVDSVAIGGIHLPNLPQLLHASIGPGTGNHLSGIALISDIVASHTPRDAASALRGVVDSFKKARESLGHPKAILAGSAQPVRDAPALVDAASRLMQVIRENTPLVHQPRDCKDLSPAIGALLINFGTITDKEGMLVAGREANVNRKPLVFDPVAVGATAFRRETSKQLLSHWQPSVIKGNAAEIGALAQSTEVLARGVDSVGSGFSDPGSVVKQLARKRAAIIVLTGVQDYISDGETVLQVSNGHELLGVITGSGCMTGTLVAAFCAAARLDYLEKNLAFEDESQLVQGDMLLGALAGVLVFNIAAEIAAAREDVKGPGTFRAALLDELYNLTPEVVRERANVRVV